MTQVIDRVVNGVDSRRLSDTLDAIQAEPALGVFQFRAHNQWVDGAHMDIRGALGLSDETRNGFTKIRVGFIVDGDAPDEELRELVELAQARSAVLDMVANGVPVEVSVV